MRHDCSPGWWSSSKKPGCGTGGEASSMMMPSWLSGPLRSPGMMRTYCLVVRLRSIHSSSWLSSSSSEDEEESWLLGIGGGGATEEQVLSSLRRADRWAEEDGG